MNLKTLVSASVCGASALALLLAPACGSTSSSGFNPTGGGGSDGGSSGSGSGGSGGSGSGSGSSSGSVPPLGVGDGGSTTTTGDGGTACVNLQCQQSACDGGGATLTGHIYDPAGNNPLYKVVAYVPNTDPEPIPAGINANSCSCGSLYTGTPIADGITGADGAFTVTNAPVGSNIPLVIQIGKWRNYVVIPKVACGTNDLDTLLPAKLTLPKTQNETKFSNIPNIAVSTGNADSLECLLERVGLDPSEYTGNPSALPDGGQAGHIHIFAGSQNSNLNVPVPNTVNPAGPSSSGTGGLWDSAEDINRYDVVLLSCEGQPTGNPNSDVMAGYVNAGGRVFASHYHFAFFSTSSDFPNVANWAQSTQADDAYNNSINATIQTTLPNGSPFPEGVALNTWLGTTVGALTGGELPIAVSRHDAVVTSSNVSTPWAQSSPGVSPASTQYFSWDMPFNAPLDDAGEPSYCGRVVFSDLHVGGQSSDYGCVDGCNNGTSGYSGVTPTGCQQAKLTPDEDAIEFILFDLSSCVTPVTASPLPPPPVPPPVK